MENSIKDLSTIYQHGLEISNTEKLEKLDFLGKKKKDLEIKRKLNNEILADENIKYDWTKVYKISETQVDSDDEKEVTNYDKEANEYFKNYFPEVNNSHSEENKLFHKPLSEKFELIKKYNEEGKEYYKYKKSDTIREGNYSLASLFFRKSIVIIDYTFPKEKDDLKLLDISFKIKYLIFNYTMN